LRKPILVLFVAGILAMPLSGWAATPPAPEGYHRTGGSTLVPGVEHIRFERQGKQSVNVAHISRDAEVALRPVSSFGTIAGRGGRVERTSAMCARVDCLAAINGDFFAGGVPVGAFASGGELLRSPKGKHHALMIGQDRALTAGQVAWSGKLVSTDLQEIALDGINIPRRQNEAVLYTTPFAPTTLTNPHGAELVLRFVAPKGRRPRIGETAIVRMVSFKWGKGDSKIPTDGAVLSAHGRAANALESIWRAVQRDDASRDALLRIDTKADVLEAIGGSPILLRDGAIWVANEDRAFVRSRAPRTVVGWNEAGDTWLVTIDGRQPGFARGMSLLEAAKLVRALGATDAINLDGGGSTTFVVRGDVVNRPSDRLGSVDGVSQILRSVAPGVSARNLERPVANALVVLAPGTNTRPARQQPTLEMEMPEVETVALPAPSQSDPASNPVAALPAIVATPPDAESSRAAPIGLAMLVNAAVALALFRRAGIRIVARP